MLAISIIKTRLQSSVPSGHCNYRSQKFAKTSYTRWRRNTSQSWCRLVSILLHCPWRFACPAWRVRGDLVSSLRYLTRRHYSVQIKSPPSLTTNDWGAASNKWVCELAIGHTGRLAHVNNQRHRGPVHVLYAFPVFEGHIDLKHNTTLRRGGRADS